MASTQDRDWGRSGIFMFEILCRDRCQTQGRGEKAGPLLARSAQGLGIRSVLLIIPLPHKT
jgi:hypothetical protein